MRWIVVLAALGLSGCGTTYVAQNPASACSTLVPSSWKDGVAHAPFPHSTDPAHPVTQGDFVDYADAESANVDTANSRQKQSLDIISGCEAHDAALVKSLTRKPLFGIF